MEHSDLGPCGWPFVVVAEGSYCRIHGQDVWADEMAWLETAEKNGSVALDSFDAAVPVYLVSFGDLSARVAIREVSQGMWVIASNDVEIRS